MNDDPLTGNINVLKSFAEKGATIIITTSRSAKYSNYIKEFLKNNGLNVKHVLCDLKHSPRVIINDFANTNPFPSCSAISFPRNSSLVSYFQYDFWIQIYILNKKSNYFEKCSYYIIEK